MKLEPKQIFRETNDTLWEWAGWTESKGQFVPKHKGGWEDTLIVVSYVLFGVSRANAGFLSFGTIDILSWKRFLVSALVLYVAEYLVASLASPH